MDIPPPCSVAELELIATLISSGFDPLKILIPPPFPDEELLFIVTLVILESQASQLMPPPPILAKFEKTFRFFNLGSEFSIRIPPPPLIVVYPLVSDNPTRTEVESSPDINVAALVDSSPSMTVESI